MKKTSTPNQQTAAKIAQFNEWKTASTSGSLKDLENPTFMFQQIPTDLLVKIVSGEIDPLFMAKMELAARGRDHSGQWVGYDKAEALIF